MKKFSSIKFQLMFWMLVPLICISTIFSVVLFLISNNLIDNHIMSQYNQNLTLSMDKFNILFDEQLVNEAKTDKKKYEQIKKEITTFQKEYNLENAYIMSNVNGEEVILALSGTEDYLKPLAFTVDQKNALSMENMIVSDIYEDEYGKHKSTFLQIPGTDSVLGLDSDADFIDDLHQMFVEIIVAIMVFAVLVGTILSVVVSRKIVAPLNKLVNHTARVASGDLTNPISSNRQDEISQLANGFGSMQIQLSKTILQVSETSSYVEESSNTLQENVGQLNEATNQVASAVQEIAASIDVVTSGASQNHGAVGEITKQIKEIHTVTSSISKEAERATDVATEGNKVIQGSVKGIQAINESAKVSLTKTEQMNNRSNEVSNITKFITNISDQINLLALNAAIEAARAGEYGKGFAVVADEIRSLAEQSTQSANDISKLINEMQIDSRASVQAISNVVTTIEQESEGIYSAGETFNTISSLVNNMNNSIQMITSTLGQIATHSQQMFVTTNETVSSLEAMNEHSQSIVASTEEQTASSEEILDIVRKLHNMVNQLSEQMSQFKI